MDGWVCLHRKILEWEWFDGESHHFKVFMYLLLKARINDGAWRGTPLKRGQIPTGRKKISSEIGIGEQRIRTVLNDLEKTGELTIKKTSKYSIITITNYETYQLANHQTNHQANQQLTSDQPATNQQLTSNQPLLDKEIKKQGKQRKKGIINIGENSKKLSQLFSDKLEIQEFTLKIPDFTAKEILSNYKEEVLLVKIPKAFKWYLDDGARKTRIGLFVTNWLENKKYDKQEANNVQEESAVMKLLKANPFND